MANIEIRISDVKELKGPDLLHGNISGQHVVLKHIEINPDLSFVLDVIEKFDIGEVAYDPQSFFLDFLRSDSYCQLFSKKRLPVFQVLTDEEALVDDSGRYLPHRLIMSFVEGETLGKIKHPDVQSTLKEALEFIEDLHTAQVIQGDLHIFNIIVDRKGKYCLIDPDAIGPAMAVDKRGNTIYSKSNNTYILKYMCLVTNILIDDNAWNIENPEGFTPLDVDSLVYEDYSCREEVIKKLEEIAPLIPVNKKFINNLNEVDLHTLKIIALYWSTKIPLPLVTYFVDILDGFYGKIEFSDFAAKVRSIIDEV